MINHSEIRRLKHRWRGAMRRLRYWSGIPFLCRDGGRYDQQQYETALDDLESIAGEIERFGDERPIVRDILKDFQDRVAGPLSLALQAAAAKSKS
jgi:hypothetical protein